MFLLLFRSRWFALLWVFVMATFAVLVTAGGTMTPTTPPPSNQHQLGKKHETDDVEVLKSDDESESHSTSSNINNDDIEPASQSDDEKP